MRKRKKAEDWRKQRREYGGSVRERRGRIYARIQYFGEDGKRHDKEREARNRTHARELIKEMRAELGSHGETALDSHRMTFRDLAAIYEKQKLVPAVIVTEGRLPGYGRIVQREGFSSPSSRTSGESKSARSRIRIWKSSS
jgi:hypothetical protein